MSGMLQWARAAVVIACLGLAVVGAALWPVRDAVARQGWADWLLPRLAVVVAVACLLAWVVVVIYHRVERRGGRRRVVLRRLHEAVASVVKQPTEDIAVRRWRGTEPQKVVISLPMEFWDEQPKSTDVVARLAREAGARALDPAEYLGVRRRHQVVLRRETAPAPSPSSELSPSTGE